MAPSSTPSRTDGGIHFLTFEELTEIHRAVVARRGGRPGYRQEGLLRACLAMPANKIGNRYAHQDIDEMAAAYLFHICDQRPFWDGNRASALLAALFFLYLHDQELTAPSEAVLDLVGRAATGKATKMQMADFLRKNCVKLD